MATKVLFFTGAFTGKLKTFVDSTGYRVVFQTPIPVIKDQGYVLVEAGPLSRVVTVYPPPVSYFSLPRITVGS